MAKTWASFPWIMVMLLAALQTVPGELHEAAEMDGAGRVRRFTTVTLPHLRPMIGIVLLLEFIWNFQHFDIIYVLTGGGPAGTTTTFATAVYETAFKGLEPRPGQRHRADLDGPAAAARRRVRAAQRRGRQDRRC